MQGCVLSPLFNIFRELTIATALEDVDLGVLIGSMQINNLCFADDTTLLAESPNELQVLVNRVVEASENFDMKVNMEKAEIQNLRRAQRILTCNKESELQTNSQIYLFGR